MPFLRNIALLLVTTLLFGCSFHSRQLQAIQQLVLREPDPLEEFAWTASWNGNQHRLYAIAVSENQTLFAFDSYYLLNIESGYLQDVQGFLPNEDAGRIELQGEELLYFVNDRLVARHQCDPWVQKETYQGGTQHSQNCNGREPYINTIDLDSNGLTSRLSFLMHPEYPSIILMPSNSGN